MSPRIHSRSPSEGDYTSNAFEASEGNYPSNAFEASEGNYPSNAFEAPEGLPMPATAAHLAMLRTIGIHPLGNLAGALAGDDT
jgi:hypothetical protein